MNAFKGGVLEKNFRTKMMSEEENIASSWTKKFKNKVNLIVKSVTVEPVAFLFMFGICLQGVINNQLYYEKLCRVGGYWFGNGTTYSDEICDTLVRHS